MKLLIDIPEHIYEHAKETTEDSRDEFDAMRAIANGTQQESRSENPNKSEIPTSCGDAISREAAVNAIYDLCGENVSLKENPWRDNPHMDAVVDALENLPSVTPQQRKTQMLDESNFDVNQYEMDLQSAYDCGRASTQQRTGRWIQKEEEGDAEPFIIWECSECHEYQRKQTTFCPNCGAKMEVEE